MELPHIGRATRPPATELVPDGGTANELRDRLKRARSSPSSSSSRQTSGPAERDRMMLDLSLSSPTAVWAGSTHRVDHPDIVISTRIRLARNLEGYAFAGRARDGERLRILSQVQQAVSAMGDRVMA